MVISQSHHDQLEVVSLFPSCGSSYFEQPDLVTNVPGCKSRHMAAICIPLAIIAVLAGGYFSSEISPTVTSLFANPVGTPVMVARSIPSGPSAVASRQRYSSGVTQEFQLRAEATSPTNRYTPMVQQRLSLPRQTSGHLALLMLALPATLLLLRRLLQHPTGSLDNYRMAMAATTSEHTTMSKKGTLADEVRQDFPLLTTEVHPGVPLVYLDSAATSQKPQVVLDALDHYYKTMNSNVHRGAHTLGNRATEAYESARAKVATFIKAPKGPSEIVFTRGATEAINLVANTWGMQELKEGDEIILSVMEHHANLVPWQLVAQKTGAVLKFVQLTAHQEYDLQHLYQLVSPRTKLVAMSHVSNVLGCVNPVREVVAAAKGVGARVLLDACQSVPHMPVNVAELGVDWLVASGHKMCGPTGIGFLWGKYDVLESMPPWQGGGEMIDEVFLDRSTWAHAPGKFEAGTPAIAQAVGLGAACDYLSSIGMDRIQEYEHQLAEYLWTKLSTVEGLVLYGPPPKPGAPRAALLAFNDTQGTHALDLLTFLDLDGVAVRAGHHCTQPLHRELGRSGSARASLYIYNTFEEVDKFVDCLRSSLAMLRG